MTFVDHAGLVHVRKNGIPNQTGTGAILQMTCNTTYIVDATVERPEWWCVQRSPLSYPTCIECMVGVINIHQELADAP